MAKGKFVAYLRVSTQRQGRSGLGLEAQREAVNNYLNGGRWKLVAEMIEIESGKRSDNRPKLDEALALCRIHNATLLVAKLDRLARNVAFVSALLESGAKVVAVDMPDADVTMLQIYSVMAEREAKAISARTKAALQVAKARGTKLGGRRVSAERFKEIAIEGRKVSADVRRAEARKHAGMMLSVIQVIQAHGATTLRQIADALNERDIPTPRGKAWTAMQVSRVLKSA